MDPTLLQQQPTGLEAWITENQALIQLVLWGSQVLFWIGMLLLLFYAVWQYKRWVNFQLGTGRSGQLPGAAGGSAYTDQDAPDVEKFVE